MSSNSCQLLNREAVKEDFDKWRRSSKKLEKIPDFKIEKYFQVIYPHQKKVKNTK